MRRNLNLLFFFIIFILSCGGGGGNNISTDTLTSSENGYSDSNYSANNEQSNYSTTTTTLPENLRIYRKQITVSVPETRQQNETGKVWYKKQGDTSFHPCNKTESSYVCNIEYFGFEKEQDIKIAFTYNFKLFNITTLSQINYIPEIEISDETTKTLEENGILHKYGETFIIKFNTSAIQNSETTAIQDIELNISKCEITN
ncbi:hypothetical protein [Phorcysia thermohydrogeniphila]|uniref:Lipoprotein n=1 Tax=Phorcysia thermohydrogeniphila TaxID=936138 RepID=A0A4R1GDZ7_9BACT|nr:hypothetical protein [Phorcysia thermohydrogeniphila]TCK03939.1 hypothetical protein CLV27_1254 [Phorcysia thermohydrogeniphila]